MNTKFSVIIIGLFIVATTSFSLNSTCNNFMVLMAGKLPWKSQDPCSDSFIRLDDRIRLLSYQMVEMNATLTIFSSNPVSGNCQFHYPNIITEYFDAKELLISYGFSFILTRMNNWKVKSFTRASDILRILLAHKYRKTYIDTDIHFLHMNKHHFETPFVGSAMWADSKCSIEISNSAFCLTNTILESMIEYIKNRIAKGNNKFEYTELGPTMFHRVLMNRFSVPLYTQNHPVQASLDVIAAGIHSYNHSILHLTGHVRKRNFRLTFIELVQAIRMTAHLPLVAGLDTAPSLKSKLQRLATWNFDNVDFFPP